MKASNAASATLLVSAIQISCNDRLAFGCWLFGSLLRTLGGLVHPAALLACGRPQLAERLPKAKRAIGDGEFGRDRQTSVLKIERQFRQTRALSGRAVGKANNSFLAFGLGADDHRVPCLVYSRRGL